ncbi:unnamed protein product [Chrysodeixis includens]|uniref:Ig-like domain-containing protein n=1 Tax=Chrysodeixis includens TaxID=689277 RepID=A0A9N8L0W5_CHRIL|nr:unnamed protein product [Chrysodeixis includens]
MKNTLSYEEKDVASVFNNNYAQHPLPTKSGTESHMNDTTNSIQVHIAIPFDLQPAKRSPLDPVRVRKVFSAKMSAPVDLEYQVHSIEGTMSPSVTSLDAPSTSSDNMLPDMKSQYNMSTDTVDGLSPGMYLLVDKPRSGYALKPVKSKIDMSALNTRQAEADSPTPGVAATLAASTASVEASSAVVSSTPAITERKVETTSLKNLAKVTLSKDFIAAVNKQLIELYENITRVMKDTDKTELENKLRDKRNLKQTEEKKGKELGNKERELRELKQKEEKKGKELENKKRKGRGLKQKEEKTRITRSVFKHNAALEAPVEYSLSKRRIDWDAVKKYFGHDRVCNCKCKANKAMCRACAASDAVIDELTFEFDNLGNYMKDHCTEIQTFFWMNPSGGQKLRDSVSRIDKSLNDYYKRVKGKCQGRPCKTFTNYVDKRRATKITKTHNVPKGDAVKHLLDDITGIAEDLNKTVALKTCFNKKLKEEGENFIRIINNCLQKKHLDKRSPLPLSTKRKLIKNVYSLDNINVNIICNPEVSSTVDPLFSPTTVLAVHTDTTTATKAGDHLFDYEIDDIKHKKRKGFKKLFPRKNKKDKMFTYYASMFTTHKKNKLHFKRQVNAMVTPLISDGGGSFWYEYLKGITNEPRVVRESSRDTQKFGIAVLQTGANQMPRPATASGKLKPPLNTIYMTVKTSSHKRMVQRDTEPPMSSTTTDKLSNDINKLLQLFGSLQDIEAMNMNSNRSTMFLAPKATKPKKVTKKPEETRAKPLKTVKNKMHYRGPIRPADPRAEPTKVSTTVKPEVKEPVQNAPQAVASKTTSSKVVPAPMPQNPEPSESPKINENATLGSKENAYEPSNPEGKLDTNPQETDTTSQWETSTSSPSYPNTYPQQYNMSVPDTTSTTGDSTSTSPLTTTTKTTITTPTKTTISTTKLRTKVTITSKTSAPKAETRPTPRKYEYVLTDNRVFEATKATTGHNGKQKTTAGLINKIKTATLKFFDNMGKGFADNVTETPTTIEPTRTSTYFEQTDEVNFDSFTQTEMNLMSESTPQVTTRMSPTIVIINEYDNPENNDILTDPNRDSEGYKNLLMSIIQYETNKLNDEWHEIAYGGKGRDEDYKRSISQVRTGTSKNEATDKEKPLDETDEAQNLNKFNDFEIRLPEPVVTKKPPGLFDKIASKFGMKVPGGKKKVVHNIYRDVAKNTRKKKDKPKTPMIPVEEACESRQTSQTSQICDIKATYDHILEQQKKISPQTFEDLVKNISCYKYRDVVSHFFIPFKTVRRRWDWIRNRRSLNLQFSRLSDDSDLYEELDIVNFDDNDSYEKYVKGDDGIYRIVMRSKRENAWEKLDLGLRNMPPLVPDQNELFAMEGDTITLDCLTTPQAGDKQFLWRTDRSSMLDLDNVEVNGVKVVISNVEPKNVGRYICSQDNRVQRNVKLNVMVTPAFDVVFLPIYKTSRSCSYSDLRAIQLLGPLMAEQAGCGDVCSVRIDEPVCQKDRGTNSSLLTSIAVLSLGPPRINCSVQCRRDLISSLVVLSATNTPILSSVGVLISKDGVNGTLKPCTKLARPVVTHTLRRKDSNGHREYRKLATNLIPGKLDVVLICPAGYYLLHEDKICASCPLNTSSAVGDNTCTECPRGTRSDPGAAVCSAGATQPRSGGGTRRVATWWRVAVCCVAVWCAWR